MNRLLTLLFALCVCWQTTAEAQYGPWDVYPEAIQKLEACYVYEGDRHEDFEGNLAVMLSDGSCWKIHPKDVKTFNRWFIGDYVHVAVRSSFYWFKREHHFKLVNHNNSESVKAMLVRHKTIPLVIAGAQEFVAEIEVISEKVKDANGNEMIQYTQVPIYHKKVYLSDGSIWIIEKNIEYYKTGRKIYVAVNDKQDSFTFFLITGSEREVTYTAATPTAY